MNKLLSFATGLLCGAAVGGALALLLTPASGIDLREQMKTRWEEALAEGQKAREETRQSLERTYFQQRR